MIRTFKSSAMLTEAFGTLVVRGLGIVMTFALTTLLARVLGPAEYGTYTAALAAATLMASLAPLGTDRILVRELAIAKQPEQKSREVAVTHLCAGLAGGLMMICAMFLGFTAMVFRPDSNWGSTALLSCVLILPMTLSYLRQWTAIPLIGTRAAVAPEQTILPLMTMAIIGVGYAFGFRFTAVVVAGVYSAVMFCVWCISLRPAAIGDTYREAWRTRRSNLQASVPGRVSEGLPFISVTIGAVLMQSCMPLIIAAGCGFKAAGFFALAAPYAALAAIPLGVFNMSTVSKCAVHFQRGEHAQLKHVVRSAATVAFVASTLIGAGVWLVAPWLTVLLGKDFGSVQLVLPSLLLAAIADSLTGPTIPVMQTLQMQGMHARTLFFFMPIQLLLVYGFSAMMDIEGAALGYLASRCLWNFVVVIAIYRQRNLLMLPYARMLLAASDISSESLPVSASASRAVASHRVDSSEHVCRVA